MYAKGRSIDNIAIERLWRTLIPNEAYYRCANNKCYNAKSMLLGVA
jgi:hypothetical protein